MEILEVWCVERVCDSVKWVRYRSERGGHDGGGDEKY